MQVQGLNAIAVSLPLEYVLRTLCLSVPFVHTRSLRGPAPPVLPPSAPCSSGQASCKRVVCLRPFFAVTVVPTLYYSTGKKKMQTRERGDREGRERRSARKRKAALPRVRVRVHHRSGKQAFSVRTCFFTILFLFLAVVLTHPLSRRTRRYRTEKKIIHNKGIQFPPSLPPWPLLTPFSLFFLSPTLAPGPSFFFSSFGGKKVGDSREAPVRLDTACQTYI